jgi:ADP-ribose pyrophosphatase YjhB (NUDIX family)
MILEFVRRRAFWLTSRVGFQIYRRFPIFGTLRAAVGIIEQQQSYLLIRRNDGRGYSFPGGLSRLWELDEQTLKREIEEETGLRTIAFERVMQYHSAAELPCFISVFKVEVSGQPRGSWEGSPQWVAGADLRSLVVPSQRLVAEKILRSAI